MGRSQETFRKKEVRDRKEKKRKDKEKKRIARKDNEKSGSLDDMIAYVDENGNITDTPPDPDNKYEVDAEDIEIGIPSQPDDGDNTKIGVVTFYNELKGYGFISDTKTKRSVFVHVNDTTGTIQKGSRVSYETEMGLKGLTAKNVKLA